MCGIVAIFARRSTPPHRDLWEDLVNHLRHRGPDEGAWWADGPFFLGHRRLSIIDLQDGGQPMATRDARYVVSFNGEIYNYVELRSELEARGCRFETHSDTEVLLHGYRTWGTDLPVHLVGMFAFAIADRHRAELFVARDRFGEKPLFYHDAGDYVAFASELRPLAALPDLPREIDVEALGGYLSLNCVPGTATLLKSVRRVAPAEWKLFTSGGCRTGTYWAPPADSEVDASPGTDEEVLEEWREKFDHAVRICLRSDVPVGIFLSGGMDSSLIAESAVRQAHDREQVATAFDRLHRDIHTARPRNTILLSLHAMSLLATIIEAVAWQELGQAPLAAEDERSADPLVARAVDFIWTRSHPPITVAKIALALAVNRRTLARRFAAERGHSILAEINDCRLNRAKRLLEETNLPVKAITYLAGFTSEQRMRATFLGRDGVPPSEYRKAARQAMPVA